jgi:hypothetical protein
LNDQIVDLQTQIANQTAQVSADSNPKLISLGMLYSDNRTNPNAPFLKITGYIVNVGQNTANNCTLYVSAIQNGNNTAINTAAVINPISAGNWTSIDLQFPYTGQPIIAYSANVDWTS